MVMRRTGFKRRHRDTGPDARTRSLVLDRDGRRCVICGTYTTQIHHRKPRGRGGTNSPSNLLTVCGSGVTGCHGRIESERAWAYEHGYLLHTEDLVWTWPVLWHGCEVALLDNGSVVPVIEVI